MAELTRAEFDSFIESTLPDNSTREISALDLRTSFFNLADSIVKFNNDIDISAQNLAEIETRSLKIGTLSLIRNGTAGFTSLDNTAVGHSSLELSFSTARNTALGSSSASCVSLGIDNVAIGVHSLGSTSVGSGNVGIGNFSLMGNKTGDFNIAIGHGAGYVAPSDSEFKFYLGAYPQASGDCDDHVAGIDTPPLLYGDLKTLQLAIGASGFRGSEKLAVSGDIIPYESGGAFSLGSGDYRWNAHIQDLYVSGNIFTGSEAASFYQFNISDGVSPPDIISNAETVTISGISGIATDYSNNLMNISAAPISGQFTELSGVEPSIFGPSGLIFSVSGAAFEHANAVGAAAGAYTHWKVSDGTKNNNITAPGNAANTLVFGGISGVTTNYRGDTNKLEISTHLISGQFDSISGVNGLVYDASGILQNQIIAISGTDGLIYDVSGILQNQIIAISGTHGLIYNASGALDSFIDDVSGVLKSLVLSQDETNLALAKAFTNSASGALRGAIADSGYLFSGILQSQITTNDSRTSGIFDVISGVAPSIFGPSGLIFHVSGAAFEHANKITAAAGSYTHWKITDGSNIENIEHSDTVKFEGFGGIQATYVPGTNTLAINSSPLSGLVKYHAHSQAGLSGTLQSDIDSVSGFARGFTSQASGFFNSFVKSASGNVLSYSEDLSGVLRGEINDLTTATVGTIDQRIAASKTDILENHLDPAINTIHTQAGLSGTLQHDIDSVSGYTEGLNALSSGYLDDRLDGISGFIYNHDFFAFDGIVHKVSGVTQRYAKSLIDDFSDDLLEGDTGKWFAGDQTLASTKPISFNSTLNIIGKDGLTTFLGGDATPFSLTVDAQPISGYLEAVALEITGVQGCFESKIRAASGLALYVSGVAREAVGASGALISGWAHDSFSYYDNRASGNISYHSGILRTAISDSGYLISGVLDSFIDLTSGNLNSYINSVSGNFQDQFTSISGHAPSIFGPSGLIFHVSGSAFEYTNKQVQALSLASDAYIHWRISDGTTVKNIRSLEETQFLGVSGIETLTKTTGASGLSISARPISGVLHGIIKTTGTNILDYVNGSFFNDIVKPEITTIAGNLDTPLDTNLRTLISDNTNSVSGLIRYTSGVLDSYIDTVSGYLDDYIVDNTNSVSGLIRITSGVLDRYILATSGSTITSAGSGLVRLSGGEFNTAGSGNFERVFLNRNGIHPSGQVVADSGKHHNIVNSSGFLVVPTANTFDDIRNEIDPVANSGAVAFAGGHMRVSNGVTWHNPPVIEGFMLEDLNPPASYSNPTSGKLLSRDESFATSDTYWVTNRDHTFAASGGYFLMAMLVNNEYRPVWSTCSGCAACE